jgi:hypothetical protein
MAISEACGSRKAGLALSIRASQTACIVAFLARSYSVAKLQSRSSGRGLWRDSLFDQLRDAATNVKFVFFFDFAVDPFATKYPNETR